MQDTIDIRRFGLEDQFACKALIQDGLGEYFFNFDETRNPDLFNIFDAYLLSGDDFFVALHQSKIVGTVGIRYVGKQEDSAEIVRMSVDKNFRKHGIARGLFQKVIQEAKAKGRTNLIAMTEHNWDVAIMFYKKMGFFEFGRDEVDVHLKYTIINE